jgi:hypothetical protein
MRSAGDDGSGGARPASTDALARNHVSPLKELAPLPGRDLTIAYRVLF